MNEEKKLSKVLDEIWRFYEADKQSLIEFFRSGYKHFDKQAKEKEADKMEKELNLKRESIEQIKSLIESSAQELSPRLEYDDDGNVVQIGISGGTVKAQEPSEAEVKELVKRWNQTIAERVNVQMKKDFVREEIGLVYPGTENLKEMLKEYRELLRRG